MIEAGGRDEKNPIDPCNHTMRVAVVMAPMKFYTTSVGSSANDYEFAFFLYLIRVLQNICFCDIHQSFNEK